MTTRLSHDAKVRLAAWTHSYATVGTLHGYCGERAEKFRARGEAEAWTVYAGSVISADPGHYERNDAKVASATIIADGETVEIEGAHYTVHVNKGNGGHYPLNSDPISFRPKS